MSPSYACPHCKGTGRIELTGVYAETLAMLKAQIGPLSGAAIASMAGCKATAMNNRLAKLEQYGYARSRRNGRERLFEAVRSGVPA